LRGRRGQLRLLYQQTRHLLFPLFLIGALNAQPEFVDCSCNWQSARHCDHASHAGPSRKAIVHMGSHGPNIVRNENTPMVEGLSKEFGILHPAQSSLLNSWKIEVWQCTKHATYDRVVEVFIGEQAKHQVAVCSCAARRARIFSLMPPLKTGAVPTISSPSRSLASR